MTAHYGPQVLNIQVADHLHTCTLAATSAFDQEIAGWVTAGLSFNRSTMDDLRSHLIKVVQTYIARDPMPKTWRVVAVEESIAEEGNLRPDMICVDESGVQVAVDFKTKVELAKVEWKAKWLEGFSNSWQQHHQAAAIGGGRYVVVAVVGKPFSATWEVYPFTQEQGELFCMTAQRMWGQLQRAHEVLAQGPRPWHLPGAVIHENKYGECELLGVCTRGMSEATLQAEGFVRVERRR